MSLLSLSPSPFSCSPLHGFRLPKSSSGRSGGCGEADWAAFFQPMTDDYEQAEHSSGSSAQLAAEHSSSSGSSSSSGQLAAEHGRQLTAAAPAASSLPFLSALESSPPLLSPSALFSPLDSLHSSSPLFSSLSPQPLHSSSSLTASLFSRHLGAQLSARLGDAAAASSLSLAASASCATASFAPPAVATAAAASLPSAAASRSSAVAEAQRSRDGPADSSRGCTLSEPAAAAAFAASPLSPSSSSPSSSPASSSSPHCALSDMSNDHYLTFEVLSLDSMTGCIASEEHPFAPSTSAVFDFVSLHAPLQDAANAANAAAGEAAAGAASSSCLLQLCDDEASGELCSSRPMTPSTAEDADAEDEDEQQQQQQQQEQLGLRLLSPATSAVYSSSTEMQPQQSQKQHSSLTGRIDSFAYATERRSQRMEAVVGAAPSRGGSGDWGQQRYQHFAPQQQQQQQHAMAALPPLSFYAPRAPPLAAGGDGMETDCGLSCAGIDALVCCEAADGQMNDHVAAAAGSRVSELRLARSRTAADGLDSTARRRHQQQQSQSQAQRHQQQQQQLSRQPLSPRSTRRFSFPALRSVGSAASSSSSSSSSSSCLFPPPLSPSSRVSSASSPLPRSLGSEEDGSGSGSSGVSSLLPTPSHSPLPVMAASVTPASVMAHQITPVTAMRILPAAATITAAAAVPEVPVTARAISSPQQQQQQQQQQPVHAAMPNQGSPTPATAVSSPSSSVKAIGNVSVGTVIAEAALASVASVSTPIMAAVPSTAPQMATATFSGAAAASAPSAACSPVLPAHSVAVVPSAASLPSLPLPASSSPVHRARVVGSGGLHPRQAFTLPHSKKLRTARHPHPQHQQPMQAAAAAASAAPLLAASCLSLQPPGAPVPANALDGRFWKGSSSCSSSSSTGVAVQRD